MCTIQNPTSLWKPSTFELTNHSLQSFTFRKYNKFRRPLYYYFTNFRKYFTRSAFCYAKNTFYIPMTNTLAQLK